ncbi:hypothetical protein HK101_007503 [Irineochytrium annulatum]|nr:hypothetical protein HK101_007503 [Irineochytrium annulatum]
MTGGRKKKMMVKRLGKSKSKPVPRRKKGEYQVKREWDDYSEEELDDVSHGNDEWGAQTFKAESRWKPPAHVELNTAEHLTIIDGVIRIPGAEGSRPGLKKVRMALRQEIYEDGDLKVPPVRVRSLREMCLEAVAKLINHVETLEGLPWDPFGHVLLFFLRNGYGPDGAMENGELRPDIMALFFNAYSDEFAENTYLALKGVEVPPTLISMLDRGLIGSTLRAIELSSTNLCDQMAPKFSRLPLLDLRNTLLTNDGLRALARPVMQCKLNPITGLPIAGLIKLAYLNLSSCIGIRDTDGRDSSDSLVGVLMRFPSLQAVDLSGCGVSVTSGSVFHMMRCCGWMPVPGAVELFPGFRSTSLMELSKKLKRKREKQEEARRKLRESAATEEASGVANTASFFGQEAPLQPEYELSEEELLQYEARETHDATSRKVVSSLVPEAQEVVVRAHSLLQNTIVNDEGVEEVKWLPRSNRMLRSLFGRTMKVNPMGVPQEWWVGVWHAAKLPEAQARECVRQHIVGVGQRRNCQLIRSHKTLLTEIERRKAEAQHKATELARAAVAIKPLSKVARKRLDPEPQPVRIKYSQEIVELSSDPSLPDDVDRHDQSEKREPPPRQGPPTYLPVFPPCPPEPLVRQAFDPGSRRQLKTMSEREMSLTKTTMSKGLAKCFLMKRKRCD